MRELFLTADAHLGRHEKAESELQEVIDKGEKVIMGRNPLIIFGGDMVDSISPNGLDDNTEIDKRLQGLERIIQETFLHDKQRLCVPGNHDVGYCSLSDKGINSKAIEIFESNFNQVFWSFKEDRYVLVGLSSDLILNGGDSVSESINKKQSEQTEFLKDTIRETKKNNQKVILFLHDPMAVRKVMDIIEWQTGNLEKVFCGHHHAQWTHSVYPVIQDLVKRPVVGKMIQKILEQIIETDKVQPTLAYAQGIKRELSLWNTLQVTIIPAPGGMFGVGGGFLTAKIENEELSVKRYFV